MTQEQTISIMAAILRSNGALKESAVREAISLCYQVKIQMRANEESLRVAITTALDAEPEEER